jgi:hypothetical protein
MTDLHALTLVTPDLPGLGPWYRVVHVATHTVYGSGESPALAWADARREWGRRHGESVGRTGRLRE